MARDDSLLDTGLSSAAERRIAARQEELHNARQRKHKDLTPGAEVIVEWIDQERADVIEELAKLPMAVETTDRHVKSELRAIQLHLDFLARLKMKTKNVLREAKREEVAAAREAKRQAKEARRG